MSPIPFWRALLDFFLPPKCPFCGTPQESASGGAPCPPCLSRVRFFASPRCPRCGIGHLSPADGDHLCSECLTEERAFSRARAVCHYQGAIREAIARFKYRGALRLARPLGELLAGYRDEEFPLAETDLLIPVPLHPSRLRQRGFNQSLLLARQVSRRHGIPLNYTALLRTRPTQPQARLSGPERQTNLRGAFEVLRPEAVAEKRVLLLDDVFTTGATVQECARTLVRAGAREVRVLTLARVP